MKLEIEKERQKMFKEFKEMQDNLYSMNKKSLNILSTSEVNQKNEAPLDVFLKRLSRSSIS
jgi:phosphate uptake regulator